MSKREKTLKAIRRTDGGYIPFEFGLCPLQYETFKEKTGSTDYAEYYDFPIRGVYAILKNRDPGRFKKYFDDQNIYIDPEWGVGHIRGNLAHFTRMVHPMEDFTEIEEFMAYPYPDADTDYDWEQFKINVNNLKAKDVVVAGGLECTVFETAWYMRGMENLFIDMSFNEELAVYHLDRITDIKCKIIRQYAEAGCDIIRLGDDVSTQLDMMMSPEMWRKNFKGRLHRVIQEAKNAKPDVLIFYHGDGNLQKIIPDLIEIGVEILNPIQPECMDPFVIKRNYGDRLTIWGTIGTQTIMPFGTPEEVRDFCKKMIGQASRDNGGLVLAPTHLIEPEVPWENIRTFINTVKEYNKCQGNF